MNPDNPSLHVSHETLYSTLDAMPRATLLPSALWSNEARLFVAVATMVKASAKATVTGFRTLLHRIDAQRRLALTCDQGRKLAQYERLSETTGVRVCFADPHSPWQRRINENSNGLLRQSLPKGTDLSSFGQNQFDRIAWELNSRPRKRLAAKCTAELSMPEPFDFYQLHHQLVALRT